MTNTQAEEEILKTLSSQGFLTFIRNSKPSPKLGGFLTQGRGVDKTETAYLPLGNHKEMDREP